MDKIYVIVDGVYSDWSILGYTNNEEEAKQICANYSLSHKEGEYYYDVYYLEVNGIKFLGQKREVLSRYEVNFYKNAKGWTKNWTSEYVNYYKKENKVIESNNGEQMSVFVYIEPNNKEKAEKIAEDFLYKYLAEKEGI